MHTSEQSRYPLLIRDRWVWPALLIPLVFFAPESPWWLVRRGRAAEARKVVSSLTGGAHKSNYDIDKNMALMTLTTQKERELSAQATYKDCFKGISLRRTLIMIGVYVSQCLNGGSLRGSAAYFFEQAGLPTEQAFNMSIVVTSVAIAGGYFSVSRISSFLR